MPKFQPKKWNKDKYTRKSHNCYAYFLNKKSYEQIKNSQKKAFTEILKISKIPFREFKINTFDEKTIADLFLLFIFETILMAKLMKVDAFNQPAVEKVKILTKKFLT